MCWSKKLCGAYRAYLASTVIARCLRGGRRWTRNLWPFLFRFTSVLLILCLPNGDSWRVVLMTINYSSLISTRGDTAQLCLRGCRGCPLSFRIHDFRKIDAFWQHQAVDSKCANTAGSDSASNGRTGSLKADVSISCPRTMRDLLFVRSLLHKQKIANKWLNQSLWIH